MRNHKFKLVNRSVNFKNYQTYNGSEKRTSLNNKDILPDDHIVIHD